jgi:zinc transport system permease protein
MFDHIASLVGLLPFSWSSYQFMQHALIGIILLAPLFSLPGCIVIDSRMAFFSDAIGHATLTGIAIGVLFGLENPFWVMISLSVVLALILSILRAYGTATTDTLIGIIMAGATAFGIVILSRGGGFNKFSRFLIGDILSLTGTDLNWIFIGLLSLVVVWIFFANRLFLLGFNRSLAFSRGHTIWLEETLFSVTIAVIVTAAVQWIGVLVINSFLILPAASARNISRSIRSYSLFAIAVALCAGISGIIISFYAGTAAGATIILVQLAIYCITLIVKSVR